MRRAMSLPWCNVKYIYSLYGKTDSATQRKTPNVRLDNVLNARGGWRVGALAFSDRPAAPRPAPLPLAAPSSPRLKFGSLYACGGDLIFAIYFEALPSIHTYTMVAPEVTLTHLNRADGSATYTHNGYSIIGAVNGPIEVQRRDEQPEEATLEVNIRPSAGVGSR